MDKARFPVGEWEIDSVMLSLGLGPYHPGQFAWSGYHRVNSIIAPVYLYRQDT